MQNDGVVRQLGHRPGLGFLIFSALVAQSWGWCLDGVSGAAGRDGEIVKKALKLDDAGANLVQADAWRPWQSGFVREGDTFVCDNGADARAQRGASQTVVLNQEKPEPIVATAWSKAEGVGGTRDHEYSLYLDLQYTDGTPLWGQVDSWAAGT